MQYDPLPLFILLICMHIVISLSSRFMSKKIRYPSRILEMTRLYPIVLGMLYRFLLPDTSSCVVLSGTKFFLLFFVNMSVGYID